MLPTINGDYFMTVGELRAIIDKTSEDAYTDETEIFIYNGYYPDVESCCACPMIVSNNKLNRRGQVALVFQLDKNGVK